MEPELNVQAHVDLLQSQSLVFMQNRIYHARYTITERCFVVGGISADWGGINLCSKSITPTLKMEMKGSYRRTLLLVQVKKTALLLMDTSVTLTIYMKKTMCGISGVYNFHTNSSWTPENHTMEGIFIMLLTVRMHLYCTECSNNYAYEIAYNVCNAWCNGEIIIVLPECDRCQERKVFSLTHLNLWEITYALKCRHIMPESQSPTLRN